ncbi:STAS-like domain-containing protein [Paraburkholderia phenoliruptrix]|uniref:STAS-like domain-containing protein n=1 Tax=Paraburkholderia phenoliruptrix TaxID=252970 RepID=UPI001C4EBB33|nr:STAS-like domain-containing protein [Paraburkholderia phenoliruptrix]MBW0449271.1 STAS-like domain-containing protein [Paraburkholderia phenoliruptrix]MBW9097551.1 STAS-like domain-containing protein [Paraburkholderia phenoliruptrix]
MQTVLAAIAPPHGFYGTRSRAFEFRDQIEQQLDADVERVVIEFSGVSATQSFVDELLGVLVVERGPAVVRRLVFKGCSEDLRAIIRFVLNDRIEQLEDAQARH